MNKHEANELINEEVGSGKRMQPPEIIENLRKEIDEMRKLNSMLPRKSKITVHLMHSYFSIYYLCYSSVFQYYMFSMFSYFLN